MSTVTRKKRFVLGRRHNGIRMTPAEFDAIEVCDDLYSYELINGVLVVNAYAAFSERNPNEELGRWLRNYEEQNPGVLDATVFEEYIFLDNSRRRADRVIWTGLGRLPIPEQDFPTIVIEFVSKRRRDWLRDYVEKKGEYLALGIKEYWIINRFRRTLTVYRRAADGVEEEKVVTDREVYTTNLLPGFELPVGRLLDVGGLRRRRSDVDTGSPRGDQ